MKNQTRVVITLILCVAFAALLAHHLTVSHGLVLAAPLTADLNNSSAQPQRKTRPTAGMPPGTLVSGLTRPDHVAVDQTHVYCVARDTQLNVMSKSGGPTTLFETSGEDLIKAVVADGTGVYVLTSNRLMKVDPESHDSFELAKTESNEHQIVIDETHVYWIGRLAGGKGYQLIKVAKKGGTTTAIATEIFAPQPDGLAIDQTTAFWLDYADDTLKSVSKEGGTPKTVLKFSGPQALSVDEKYIYTGAVNGSILKLDKNGGAPQTLVPAEAGTVFWIVSDADYLYYVADDRIMKVSKSGGRAAVVARNLEGSFRFAVEGCCVYWSTFKTGRVMKSNK